jgi:hypothetical protein
MPNDEDQHASPPTPYYMQRVLEAHVHFLAHLKECPVCQQKLHLADQATGETRDFMFWMLGFCFAVDSIHTGHLTIALADTDPDPDDDLNYGNAYNN